MTVISSSWRPYNQHEKTQSLLFYAFWTWLLFQNHDTSVRNAFSWHFTLAERLLNAFWNACWTLSGTLAGTLIERNLNASERTFTSQPCLCQQVLQQVQQPAAQTNRSRHPVQSGTPCGRNGRLCGSECEDGRNGRMCGRIVMYGLCFWNCSFFSLMLCRNSKTFILLQPTSSTEAHTHMLGTLKVWPGSDLVVTW